MSDDEDEGRLQIDESPSDSEDKPSISAPPPLPPPLQETPEFQTTYDGTLFVSMINKNF